MVIAAQSSRPRGVATATLRARDDSRRSTRGAPVTTNPLVAGPVDTSTATSGAGVVDDLVGLSEALRSGNWLAIGLSGVGTALDGVAAASDPLGSLIAAGLGWLMDHLQPLKGWLDDLTGDAGAVLGYAGTWENVSKAMGNAGDELSRVVRADLEGMSGASIAAYTAYAEKLADHIKAGGGSASAMASALKICGQVVQAVHDLVRDTLAQLVGSAISWAAEAVFSFGLATPWIVEQVSTRVSSLAARIGTKVKEVVESASALRKLLDALKGLLARVGAALRRGAKDGEDEAAAAAKGLPVSDGKPRTYDDQLADPHVHPNNVSIVEPGYDPYGGLTPAQFDAKYHSKINERGEPDWDWPPHDGAEPGTVTKRPLTPGEDVPLDRIGGAGGSYFSPRDTPFSERALPPDRLNFDRTGWELNPDSKVVQTGRITVEESKIAGWFGQSGGGIQYRFLLAGGRPLSQAELVALKIIRKVA
jgi:hypothetical protein